MRDFAKNFRILVLGLSLSALLTGCLDLNNGEFYGGSDGLKKKAQSAWALANKHIMEIETAINAGTLERDSLCVASLCDQNPEVCAHLQAVSTIDLESARDFLVNPNNVIDLVTAINSMELVISENPLFLNGTEKDAIVNLRNQTIALSRPRTKDMSVSRLQMLIVHELIHIVEQTAQELPEMDNVGACVAVFGNPTDSLGPQYERPHCELRLSKSVAELNENIEATVRVVSGDAGARARIDGEVAAIEEDSDESLVASRMISFARDGVKQIEASVLGKDGSYYACEAGANGTPRYPAQITLLPPKCESRISILTGEVSGLRAGELTSTVYIPIYPELREGESKRLMVYAMVETIPDRNDPNAPANGRVTVRVRTSNPNIPSQNPLEVWCDHGLLQSNMDTLEFLVTEETAPEVRDRLHLKLMHEVSDRGPKFFPDTHPDLTSWRGIRVFERQ